MISGILDRGESLSDGSQRSGVGVGLTVVAASRYWRPAANHGPACRTRRDLLFAADRLSVALASPRLPGMGHRVSLFPQVEAYGRVELRSGSHLRADASASGPVCVSIGRYHGGQSVKTTERGGVRGFD